MNLQSILKQKRLNPKIKTQLLLKSIYIIIYKVSLSIDSRYRVHNKNIIITIIDIILKHGRPLGGGARQGTFPP